MPAQTRRRRVSVLPGLGSFRRQPEVGDDESLSNRGERVVAAAGQTRSTWTPIERRSSTTEGGPPIENTIKLIDALRRPIVPPSSRSM